jgi:RNA polymerase-associated protein
MMQLYSGTTCPFSHRCRIVFCEKDVDVQIINVDLFDKPKVLAVMNPYDQVPVLIDRDLVLFESNIITEYIEERSPHPQLISTDPVVRARARLFQFRIEQELFSQIKTLDHGSAKQKESARRIVTEHLTQIAHVFNQQKYLLGNEISMLDVAVAPLLWRLPHYQIALPKNAGPLLDYAERIFSRPMFINSLTAAEKAMRN